MPGPRRLKHGLAACAQAGTPKAVLLFAAAGIRSATSEPDEEGSVGEDIARDERLREETPRPETTKPEAREAGMTTAVEDGFVSVPEVTDSGEGTPDGGEPMTSGPREAVAPNADEDVSLMDRDQADSFRKQWDGVQAGFVDDPRGSVEQADRLVDDVVQQLQASFTTARERLEAQWSQGADASTEDLRVSLRRYRSFFDRLLGT
jgi:hypothetical protein